MEPIPDQVPQEEMEKPIVLPSRPLIQEVGEGDPMNDQAIPIALTEEDTEESIRSKIEKAKPDYLWWEKPEYKKMGKPNEVLKVDFSSGRCVEVFNWEQPLTAEQQTDIKEVLEEFAQIAHGKALETTRYVLISPNPYENKTLKTGEDTNGYGKVTPFVNALNGIAVYTPGLTGEHRTGGASNFRGTLRHELTHHIMSPLVGDWDKLGPEHPCLTKYGETSPQEDICDSVAAVLAGNSSLDSVKAHLLQERFLDDRIEDSIQNIQVIGKDEVNLPQLETYYYKEAPKVVVH